MIRRSPLIVFCYISGIIIVFLFGISYHYNTDHHNNAIKVAETYMTTLSAVHRYYAKEISDRAEAGGIRFDAEYQKFNDRLPFPGTVAMDLGRELEKADPRLSFSLYSRYPFPWNQDRILDSFEEKSLQAFENGRKEAMAELGNRDGETIVRYAVPVMMTESCVECHNRQEFGFQSVWKQGDLRGARQVAVPVHSTGSLPDNFMVFAVVGAALIGGIGMGLVWPMVRRLELAHKGKVEDFQKLQHTEEKLREVHLALSHAMPGIAQVDPQGSYTKVNDFYASMMGYQPSDLVGHSWKPTVHEDDLPLAMSAYQAMLEKGDGEFEARAIRQDGSSFQQHVLMVKRMDSDGQLIGHHCFMRDVSEQHQAKEQLEDAYEQLQDLTIRLNAAEESERKRIAQELHDEFGQMLTGLKFDLAWLQRRLSEPVFQDTSAMLLKKIENMNALTDQLIHMIRQIATSLRPSILDDLGLLPALEWHIQDFQLRTGIACTFSTNFESSALALDNDRATALFRITQELLTNILRHAKASEVKMSLTQQNQSLILSLEDNGQGLQDHHSSTPSSSLGLLGIKERAMSFGGEFVISGKDGSGTHAIVRIPLTNTAVASN